MSRDVAVAISSDFLGAFSRLPQGVQGKVAKFVTNFQSNPTASGINYERIQGASDPNLRSVRIDQAWRGVVLKPESGRVYVLLWVDRHDDAYAWAARHRCKINPATGALQVYEVVHTQVEARIPQEVSATPPLYRGITDQALLSLGVPEDLLPAVRRVCREEELDQLESALPVEAYEGCFSSLRGNRSQRSWPNARPEWTKRSIPVILLPRSHSPRP